MRKPAKPHPSQIDMDCSNDYTSAAAVAVAVMVKKRPFQENGLSESDDTVPKTKHMSKWQAKVKVASS
jgi:hypothetical protein